MSFAYGFIKLSYTTGELKEMIDEHEQLIGVLKSPSHKDNLAEAKKQEKELSSYRKQLEAKQSVIVSKEIVKDRVSAEAVAKKFSDRIYTSRETAPSFRFRQINPSKFESGSFRVFKPKPGVSIIYGKLKETS